VILDLTPSGEGASRLRFTQLGWGDGPEWDAAYDYFDRAWAGFVLPALVYRFEKGPLDWTARPDLEPVAATPYPMVDPGRVCRTQCLWDP